MERESEVRTTCGTVVVAALVLRIELERWPELKRRSAELGGSIVYQRIAPRGSRLWILEGSPEDLPPRCRGASP